MDEGPGSVGLPDSNEELTAYGLAKEGARHHGYTGTRTRQTEATLLSKTAIWQLRHPIDMGRIFDGRELGWTLTRRDGLDPGLRPSRPSRRCRRS